MKIALVIFITLALAGCALLSLHMGAVSYTHLELGTRYDDGALTAEMGLFLINFNNQYDSNQTNDTVTARGKTRHTGLETQARYDQMCIRDRCTGATSDAIHGHINDFLVLTGLRGGVSEL